MQDPSDNKKQLSYKIDFGGRVFEVTSASGEEHIKKVEAKLAETHGKIVETSGPLSTQQTGLLIALNLADELIGREYSLNADQEELDRRILSLIKDLGSVV